MKTILAYLPSVLGLAALSFGIYYCARNGSGHSGVDPISASLCFVPILALGLLLLLLKSWRRAGLITTVVGLFGLGFGSYVSELKIMRFYGVWVKGAHDMSGHIGMQLSLYVLALLAALTLVYWLTRTPSSRIETGTPVVE